MTRTPAEEAYDRLPFCSQCGGPEHVMNAHETLCRDCWIDDAHEKAKCKECGEIIWQRGAMYLGIQPYDHAETCVSGAEERARGIAAVTEFKESQK